MECMACQNLFLICLLDDNQPILGPFAENMSVLMVSLTNIRVTTTKDVLIRSSEVENVDIYGGSAQMNSLNSSMLWLSILYESVSPVSNMILLVSNILEEETLLGQSTKEFNIDFSDW